MLQACLNGSRAPGDHPALPISPADVAADAQAVVAAGADELHLHPRAADGSETLDPIAVADVLRAVRQAVPGTPIGVTTGAWTGSATQRIESVSQWAELPDYASVNWHEDGAAELVDLLVNRGVGVEAGLWTTDAVCRWAASPHRDQCFRALLELPDGPTTAEVRPLIEAMLKPLRGVVPDGRLLLHGEGSTAWEALGYAGWAGLATRIGMEDTLVLPDGSAATGNAELVIAARRALWQGYP